MMLGGARVWKWLGDGGLVASPAWRELLLVRILKKTLNYGRKLQFQKTITCTVRAFTGLTRRVGAALLQWHK